MKVKLKAGLLSEAVAYFNSSSSRKEKRDSESKPELYNSDRAAASAFLF